MFPSCKETKSTTAGASQIFTVTRRESVRTASGGRYNGSRRVRDSRSWLSAWTNNVSRLLIIDDDAELCEMLEAYLQSQGFQVESVNRAADGIEQALTGRHALVVLDVMLPGLNGFDVLKQIRARSNVPVLMLTARGDEVDRIVGLEIGADDYLPKPFNPRELVARIRAVLRRAEVALARPGNDQDLGLLSVDDIEMDVGARSVCVDGRGIELTCAEFDLLKMLLQSAGRTVSRKEIARTVLGRHLNPFDRSVDVHISSLRRKLGQPDGEGERIRTIRAVGYLYARRGKPS